MLDIFLPYLSPLDPIVQWSLKDYLFTPVEMTTDTSYWEYFAERWAQGSSFINHEHDILSWPGGPELLTLCRHYWCLYRYNLIDDVTGSAITPIGLVKFTNEFIERLPHLWERDAAITRDPTGNPRHWLCVDEHLHTEAVDHGLRPHIHHPPVLHLATRTG